MMMIKAIHVSQAFLFVSLQQVNMHHSAMAAHKMKPPIITAAVTPFKPGVSVSKATYWIKLPTVITSLDSTYNHCHQLCFSSKY